MRLSLFDTPRFNERLCSSSSTRGAPKYTEAFDVWRSIKSLFRIDHLDLNLGRRADIMARHNHFGRYIVEVQFGGSRREGFIQLTHTNLFQQPIHTLF